jgi:anti-sigma B factor antagonist
MQLTAQDLRGWTVVTVLEDRIDAAAAIAFKEAMRNATDGGAGPVILDLGGVDFIDSSGLGSIVAVMKHLGGARRLHLAGLLPNVDRVFRLTRMDSIFPIHPGVEEALAALNATAAGGAADPAADPAPDAPHDKTEPDHPDDR